MKSRMLNHTNSSAQEELALNAGRIDTGKVDVDKTMKLLNEALGGQLFQEIGAGLSASKPDDELIKVEEFNQDTLSSLRDEIASAPASTDSLVAGEIKPFSPINDARVKSRGSNWLTRLTGKLSKRAS